MLKNFYFLIEKLIQMIFIHLDISKIQTLTKIKIRRNFQHKL